MTNKTIETNTKPVKVTKTVKISTKKSILIKFALIQFIGLVLLAVAIVTVAILFTRNKAEAATESQETAEPQIQYVEVEKPVEVVKEVTVEKIVEIEKPVEIIKEVKVVDQEAAQALATEMFEDYKTEYAEEQEAARTENISTIYVHIYGGIGDSNSFYIAIQGSLYERLTYAMIYNVLKEDVRFEGYKVRSIGNKDAVEVFVGEDYTSTRSVRIELK